MTLAKLIPYTNMTKRERYSVIQKFSIHGATILNFLNTFSLIVGFTTRYMQQRGNSQIHASLVVYLQWSG